MARRRRFHPPPTRRVRPPAQDPPEAPQPRQKRPKRVGPPPRLTERRAAQQAKERAERARREVVRRTGGKRWAPTSSDAAAAVGMNDILTERTGVQWSHTLALPMRRYRRDGVAHARRSPYYRIAVRFRAGRGGVAYPTLSDAIGALDLDRRIVRAWGDAAISSRIRVRDRVAREELWIAMGTVTGIESLIVHLQERLAVWEQSYGEDARGDRYSYALEIDLWIGDADRFSTVDE